jgi:hypothetical protein
MRIPLDICMFFPKFVLTGWQCSFIQISGFGLNSFIWPKRFMGQKLLRHRSRRKKISVAAAGSGPETMPPGITPVG